MGEWGDTPPKFDRTGKAWGSASASFGDDEDQGGGEQYIEVIGGQLWVAGMVNLGRFHRVSDFVNIVEGYLVMRDVVVLTQTGDATRLTLPELRLLPDDIAVVGQLGDDKPTQTTETATGVERIAQRLVVLTRSHIIDGDVSAHGDGSIMAFVDATDPKFIPMSNVRVRWVSDRRLAARYPFALLQRSQILGVATEGITLGGAEATARRVEMRRDQVNARPSGTDALDADLGPGTDAAVTPTSNSSSEA